MNGENFLQGKNPTGWILDYNSQESTNQELSGYKYKEFYYYLELSQSTNL